MARTTRITITDDIDGTEGAKTYVLGFQGTTYEVDLGDKNRDRLVRALQPFIDAGRKTGAPRTRDTLTRARRTDHDSKAIREWAKGRGMSVPDRGRIPSTIKDAYYADSPE